MFLPINLLKKFLKIISMTNSQFNPALPLPIKWSIGTDRFDPEKEVLGLTIPVESVTHLIDHLKNLVNTKASEKKVYDFNKEKKLKLNVYKSTVKRWKDHTEYMAILIHKRSKMPLI